jgi:hypothetical protein
MKACFTDNDRAIFLLNKLRDMDILWYHRCVAIMDWLSASLPSHYGICDLQGEIILPHYNTTLYGYLDRVEINTHTVTLIVFQGSRPKSLKKIPPCVESPIIPLCYIAEFGGFKNLPGPIRNVQIWSPASDGSVLLGEKPVYIDSIDVSLEEIQQMEENICEAIN